MKGKVRGLKRWDEGRWVGGSLVYTLLYWGSFSIPHPSFIPPFEPLEKGKGKEKSLGDLYPGSWCMLTVPANTSKYSCRIEDLAHHMLAPPVSTATRLQSYAQGCKHLHAIIAWTTNANHAKP